jgi:hypothetical protein
VHAPTLIVCAPHILWHHDHSKKDHKRPSILAPFSNRRENTNESNFPRNETKPKPTQKHLGNYNSWNNNY